jgi:ribosomal protein S18 acetylase RimI-like enzyme
MNITNHNLTEIISLRNKTGLENEVFVVLGDAIFEATIEKVKMIIHEFCTNNKKEILGYFMNGRLIGIIGIEINEEIEIKYIGVEKNNRKNGIGTKLINFLRKLNNQNIFAETDDDAIYFYKKYGFTCEALIKNYNGQEVKRYRCSIKSEES